MKNSISFQSKMNEAKAAGLSHSDAFAKVVRENPDLMGGMKRAPLCGASPSARAARICSEFANADDDSPFDFSDFAARCPSSLRSALGITLNDSSVVVASKLHEATKVLSGALISQLWGALIACIQKNTGDALSAAQEAKKLFPTIASEVGFSK